MKKLLLSSIVLFVFSIAMILFQFSCKKDAHAATTPTAQYLNKIVYEKYISGVIEVWVANTDGSSPQEVPITLPSGLHFGGSAFLTPDGKKIVFAVGSDPTSDWSYIYSCNLDGSNLTKIIDNPDPDNVKLELEGAY